MSGFVIVDTWQGAGVATHRARLVEATTSKRRLMREHADATQSVSEMNTPIQVSTRRVYEDEPRHAENSKGPARISRIDGICHRRRPGSTPCRPIHIPAFDNGRFAFLHRSEAASSRVALVWLGDR